LALYGSGLARDAALETLRAAAPHAAVWTGGHLTFAQFFARLDRALPPGRGAARRTVEGAARHALLEEAWRAASGRSPIRPQPTRHGLEALGRLIAAWKGAGVGPEAAQRAARGPAGSGRSAGLSFAARAYAEYERRLGPSWTDREGWERAVLARLRAGRHVPPAVLEAGRPVRVAGLFRLIPARRELLESLRQAGHPVEIVPPIPLEGFAGLRASFGTLADALTPAPRADACGVIRLEAPTPYAEVYGIGRRVRAWIEVDRVAPERIAVAFRDLGAYSQFLADVFRRLNIPYYERRGEPLAFQPLARVALSAVDAVRKGLEREPLFRFLASGPVDVAGLAGLPQAPPAYELHRLALAARMDRFFEAKTGDPAEVWRARLRAYAQASETSGQPGAAGEAARARVAADILGRVVERLRDAGADRTRAGFAQAWRELWRQAGLSPSAARTPREAETLAALDAALEDAAAGPNAERRTVGLDEFASALETAIADRAVRGAGHERAGGVRVLNLYDLQGLRFERLAVSGLNARLFPALPGPDLLLGNVDIIELRRALAGPDAGLPLAGLEPRTPQETTEEERALWELARRAARGGLLVSRSRLGYDGRPAAPSIFWQELGGADPDPADAVRPAPELEQCHTGEEAELRAAWILGGGRGSDDEQAAREAALAAVLVTPEPPGRLAELLRRACVEGERDEFFAEVAKETDGDEEPAKRVADRTGPYDGAIAPAAPEQADERGRSILHALGSAARGLAPTVIERLADCPFRFLAERVYRVSEREEAEPDLSPRDRGSLWHAVLAAFYRELLEEAHAAGRAVVDLRPERGKEYEDRLQRAAGAELDAAPGQHFTGHPGLWGLQREQLKEGLRAWLVHELRMAREQPCFRPACVEFRFGPEPLAHAPPVVVELGAGRDPLILCGQFDRLDLLVADPAAERPLVRGLRLVDYKTGNRESLKQLVKMDALKSLSNAQLPVYLAAAVQYLKRQERDAGWRVDWDELWRSANAAYYSLRKLPALNRSGDTALVECPEWPLPLKEFLDSTQDGSLSHLVRERLGLLFQGRFPVAPLKCGGVSCPARFFCRYRELPATEEDAESGGEA
jgi:hypothetical protein